MSYSIYHDLEINESIDKVFQAITEPEHLINWWPNRCTGIPKENEVYNFYFTPDYNWYGKVIKVNQNKSFHIKMTESDADWNPTSFGFDLEQKKGKIHIQFWHIGWPECNTHYKRSSFCWAMLLNGLKNYVESGKIIPFEKRE
ncbi:SRPBCC domain-containing protein [Aurantibacter crassamenti]|uniref:SRPBCC family protein n=1 Tax=Aurantibacter crassamenti TaxID=1837375 RepID=UPI00193A6783|nr:SRPBCC domain-containing protein [Aurantibacter crassamenti]MBM1107046.1 SRPBCC domain-containing protein [Aurantibacter crassamenti]